MKKWWLLFISIFLVLFFSNNVFADIAIKGYVKDSQGGGIANVIVEAVDAKSDGGCPVGPPAKNSFITASNGSYSFTFPSISGLCDYVLVTASKSGCTFSPIEYRSKFTGNDINKNFIGSCSSCTPKTLADCRKESWVCGNMPDGCGGYVNCGRCMCANGPCEQNGLSEIQLIACETAHSNNTCDKLEGLGLVTSEECCSEINLCCSNVISREDLKNVLISSLRDYFTNPDTARLNVAELKDLIIVYLSNSGNTIDLSGTGYYSKEKLIDIYNNAKSIAPQCTCSSLGLDNQPCRKWMVMCGNYAVDLVCGTCPVGQTCSNGACLGVPTPRGCIDECNSSGLRRCSGDSGYKVCGSFDSDSCLEWGTTACPSGKVCAGAGECVTATYLPNNDRIDMRTSQGGKYDYILKANYDNYTYLSASIIGLDNAVVCTYTWTFPDGTAYSGAVRATNINGRLDLRTRNWGYSNILYDYIPSGNHLLRIDSTGSGRLRIRAAVY